MWHVQEAGEACGGAQQHAPFISDVARMESTPQQDLP